MSWRSIARGVALAGSFSYQRKRRRPARPSPRSSERRYQTIPGKSLIGVVVNYPPGGATPAHHHARSAFITGYVLSGTIRSQVDSGKVQVFCAGES